MTRERRKGPSNAPQPMSFGIAGCLRDAVWFWIGPNHAGRIELKTNDAVEYDLDSHYRALASQPGGRIVWYQDERSGKLYEVAVP